VVNKADLTMFRELSDLPWANLMLGATLPPLPPEQLQRDWCGNSGIPLAQQSADFYHLVKAVYLTHGRRPLADSRLLDFGCGWARLTRLFGKDLPADRIFGCDSDAQILEWCREVPGTFRQSESRPRRLPFDERFDLAFAFSVFTHLGPGTHNDALSALHRALDAEGVLIVTIRPRGFLEIRGGELARLPEASLQEYLQRYDAGEFVHHPYNLPLAEGEVPYGEALIPLAYIRKHWTDRFEILDEPALYASDPYQQMLVLRKR
jgi:SAM-dependent methyltransferase